MTRAAVAKSPLTSLARHYGVLKTVMKGMGFPVYDILVILRIKKLMIEILGDA